VGVAVALALAGCGGGVEDVEPGASDQVSERPGAQEATSPAGDSLVLVMNSNEAPLHFTPTDWVDLFHFRFAEEVLMPSPESSPLVMDFMEGVIVAETRRTGVVDAGFDWLRRLDTTVLTYEDEADDIRWRLRQGHAWFAVLPASEVGPLLDRQGFELVSLRSGFDPSRWGGEDEAEEGVDAPGAPSDWFNRWVAEVRGRG
jgi:hypothetical protein